MSASTPFDSAAQASCSGPGRPDALPTGSLLDGFEVERVLGADAFGIVYLAAGPVGRQVEIEEYFPVSLASRAERAAQVALRVPSNAAAFERGRSAFAEEAQLLIRCRHPSLPRMLRSWNLNGTTYRAMPHAAGAQPFSLPQAADRPPSEAWLRAWLDSLLGALQAMHRAHALHRHISPRHILMLPDGVALLRGFDAARRAIAGDEAFALMALQEPAFAPIEQFSASPAAPAGPWTDLYALAAVAHCCIAGRSPAPAWAALGVPYEPLEKVVAARRARFPGLQYSASFLAAIDAALAVWPKQRPQSVAQFRAALDLAAPAHSPWERPGSVSESGAAENRASAAPADAPVSGVSPVRPASDAARETTAPPMRADGGPRFTPPVRRRRSRLWPAGVAVAALMGVLVAGWAVQRELGFDQALHRLALSVQPGHHASVPPSATAGMTVAAAPAPSVTDDALQQLPPPAAVSATPVATAPTTPEALPAAPVSVAKPPAPEVPPPAAPVATDAKPRAAAAHTRARTVRRDEPAAREAAHGHIALVSLAGARAHAASPREICGERTEFSLYRCMQTQCAQPQWAQHAQCRRLRAHDAVE